VCSGSSRRRACRTLAVSLCTGIVASPFAAWCHPGWSDDDKKNAKAESNSGNDDPVYDPGGDVKPPKLVHYVEPAFSSSSKEAFVEGTVKISTVIATDGKPTEARVVKGLNTDEDRTATEAVMQWRFTPGTKSGKPVKVRVNVEVDFHLL
jgi:TonB family protein